MGDWLFDAVGLRVDVCELLAAWLGVTEGVREREGVCEADGDCV